MNASVNMSAAALMNVVTTKSEWKIDASQTVDAIVLRRTLVTSRPVNTSAPTSAAATMIANKWEECLNNKCLCDTRRFQCCDDSDCCIEDICESVFSDNICKPIDKYEGNGDCNDGKEMRGSR